MLRLRDYQEEAMKAIIDEYKSGVTRQLVIIATGGGKTVVFASLARVLKKPTLVLAHRDELVRQAADKFSIVWPEASLGIVKAQENDHQGKDVVVASVQTLSRPSRLEEFDKSRFGLMVVDEAHHVTAGTYTCILNGLGFMEDDLGKLLLGVTATGFRGDGVGLGKVFQKITFQRSILSLIKAGYLVDIKGLAVKTDTDISSVEIKRGDYDEKQLGDILNNPARNQIIVKAFKENASGRRAIAFTVDVQHAVDLAAVFRANGIKAEAVWGDMPYKRRVEVLEAFSKGDIQVVTNCGILTEGVDIPATDCVIMARPTRSRVLFVQMLGRGTRLYPGKQDCLVIDVADNCARNDALTLPTLFGLDEVGGSLLEAVKKKAASKKHKTSLQFSGPVIAPEDVVVEQVEVLARSAFQWTVAGDVMRLPVAPGEYIYLVPLGGGLYSVEYRQEKGTRLLNQRPLDIGYAQGLAEEYLREKLGWKAKYFASKEARWRKQPPSEKQVEWLVKLGLFRPGITRGEAAEMLDKFFAARQAAREKKRKA
ncbi:DEAD/DEAH box helicase [Moorella naiadis]|uniref:DEAD/DEAH box helicase n=1 Tax=Moorella naiadis (nom. illeg.) TaxID=3093670 RepID=UPI003D9C8638